MLRDTFQTFKGDASLSAHILAEIERISPSLGERTRDVLSDILVSGGINPIMASTGWVYTGVLEKEPWSESIFKFTGKPKDRPEPGDVMIATDQVYLRKGPREFEKEFGYVNQEAIGVVNVGVSFKVEEIVAAPTGYLWMRGGIVN